MRLSLIQRVPHCEEIAPMHGLPDPPPDAREVLAEIARRDELVRRAGRGGTRPAVVRISRVAACAFRAGGGAWRSGYGGVASVEPDEGAVAGGGRAGADEVAVERVVLVGDERDGPGVVCDDVSRWAEAFGPGVSQARRGAMDARTN